VAPRPRDSAVLLASLGGAVADVARFRLSCSSIGG
jgi:hypothetical protein